MRPNRQSADVKRGISDGTASALAKVKLLSGFLPFAPRAKIRNDEGYWEQVETYIRHHLEAEFSHGICRIVCGALSAYARPT
jgi:hypothetical protein